MKKYLVSMNYLEYLESREIEANSKEEAREKYYQLWEEGMIDANDSEIIKYNIEEIKGV